jgi:lysozyme
MVPTIAVAGVVVLLAFVLGRASAGGGGEAAVRAPATRQATTTTTTRDTTHTVAQGESLLAIASRYGLTLDQLAAANGITNANKVFVGQVLKIPSPFPSASTTLPASTTTTTSTTKKP